MGSRCWRSARSLLSGSHSLRKAHALGMEIERVGQDDTAEGLVVTVVTDTTVKRLFDVDRRDIVGEQDKLVGVKLPAVLAMQIAVVDQRRLQQPHQKDARAREGIEHVDAFVAEGTAELAAQHVIRARQDEVDDLGGGVDDAKPVRVLL